MGYDPQELEAEWRDRWAESGRYEADPDGRDSDDGEEPRNAAFVTVPYPYPNGGMHIGHARTYTVPDVYARYRRQRGDNVLSPIGWHVTGTPIIGAVERLKSGDEDQIDSLKNAFDVPESDLHDLRGVTNPVTAEEIVILPAGFVDADGATGVVMSVPAHSPDDWVALRKVKDCTDELTEYGLDPNEIRNIEPRAILPIEGYGEFPARDAVEEHGVESSSDPALEEATQQLYNREFHRAP